MTVTENVPSVTTTAALDQIPTEDIKQNKLKIIITLKETTEISNTIYNILFKALPDATVTPTKKPSNDIMIIGIVFAVLFGILLLYVFGRYLWNALDDTNVKYLLTETPYMGNKYFNLPQ
jgi:hypothetical protein